MGPKKDKKRKLNKVDDCFLQTLSTSKSARLTVSGVKELKKESKEYAGKSVEELEIKASGQGNNTVQDFASGLSEIRKLFPNLKSLNFDASAERDECDADVLHQIFKTWNGSKTLETLSLYMDWAQFQELDSVLTGFSRSDCIKLKNSLGTTKNLPTRSFKKSKYSLASLPGLKHLEITMCEVERVDHPDPPSFNKEEFEIKIFVLSRYLFSRMKKLRVEIEFIGDADSDEDKDDLDEIGDDDDNCDEGNGDE